MKFQGGMNLSCSDFSFYLLPKVTHTIRNPYISDRVNLAQKLKLYCVHILFCFNLIVLFLTFQYYYDSWCFDFHYMNMRCFIQIELFQNKLHVPQLCRIISFENFQYFDCRMFLCNIFIMYLNKNFIFLRKNTGCLFKRIRHCLAGYTSLL